MSEYELPQNMPKWMIDHTVQYLEDPDAAHMWDSTVAGGTGPLQTLLLIHTGAKSGKQRALPLLYQKIGDAYVIIASKGGAPAHPSWYLNLVANPDCEIRVGSKALHVRARTTDGAERQSMWDQMAEFYPPYTDYRERAGERVIPVIALEERA